MSWLARVAAVLRNLLSPGRVERDLDDELRAYLGLLVEERRRAGMSPADARRAALVELRGLDQVKERVRDVRGGAVLEQTWRDARYALRMAARDRRFTGTAVLTLALGVGATTAMFSLVDTVVFRPLPYRESDRLVKIWATEAAAPVDNISLLEFKAIEEQNRVFETVAADDGMDVGVLRHDGRRESANGALVTPGWLATLGVQPAVGRGFLPDEGQPGRDGVIILTHEYWARGFQSDPAVVGQTLEIDGQPSAIVGVLPANVLRYGADFLKPLVAAEYRSDPLHRDLDVVARLRPGVTVSAAQAEVDVIAGQLARGYPPFSGRRLGVVPLDKYYAAIQPGASRGLTLLLGAVGVVLLIGCVNVANLLLARAAARGRECFIRAAVGASRNRLISQLLLEHLVLFVLGGTLGSLLAWWLIDAVVAFAVAEGYAPQRMAISVDGRVLTFALLLSLVSGLSFGLAPALRASRLDLSEGLRGAGQIGSAARRARTRRCLIVGELTLSLVLLIGFGLLARSVFGLQALDPGFDPSRLLETISEGGRSFHPAVAYWRSTLQRTHAIAGVESAAVTSRPPLHGARTKGFDLDGAWASGEEPRAGDILVSAGYFRTLGIPIIKGRPFTERDTHASLPVVVISQALAERYFPGQNPLGRRLRLNEQTPMSCCSSSGPVENVWREIVGIAADVRQGNLDEPPAVTLYRPFTQIVEHDMYLVVKAYFESDMKRIAAILPSELRALHPNSQWWNVRPTTEAIQESESLRSRRFMLIVLGVLAVLALLLAAVGLYGVMSYFVLERRHEIAIRIALGARRSVVLAHVVGEAGRLAAAGLLLGIVAAHYMTRLIASFLFGVGPHDVVTYVAVAAVLGAVALLGSYLPARRAASIDPINALKE